MKNILFTGARSGIARCVIDSLVDHDYQIYLTVHNDKQLKTIQEKYQTYSNVHCHVLDITKKEDREKALAWDIDILVNNAAIGEGGSIAEIDMDLVRHNFEVNVFSSFSLVQLLLPQMVKKKKGKIIIMGSLAGIVPIDFLGSYCATKASIIKLSETLRRELKLIQKKADIAICLVEPGLYHTGFNQVMLENKYEWMKKESLFEEELALIRKRENIMTTLLEKQRLQSIVRKIVKAIEADHPRFLYRAPFSQVFMAKLYQLFN